MTRTEYIEQAIATSLARHREALDAAVGVGCLRLDLRFDRSTGLPTKAVLHVEMENFIVSRKKILAFSGDETILPVDA